MLGIPCYLLIELRKKCTCFGKQHIFWLSLMQNRAYNSNIIKCLLGYIWHKFIENNDNSFLNLVIQKTDERK